MESSDENDPLEEGMADPPPLYSPWEPHELYKKKLPIYISNLKRMFREPENYYRQGCYWSKTYTSKNLQTEEDYDRFLKRM